jgi:hypothetical protein
VPAGAGAKVGGEPTATADAGAGDGDGVAVRVGRWSRGGSIRRRSTTGWSSHNLPLLGFLVCADGIVCGHDIAHKLWKCPSRVERHALL